MEPLYRIVSAGESSQEISKPHTSVSMAKGGFHESGGMILHMPYWRASGEILRMYSKGSFHSSSVGRYVGASWRPWGRFFFLTGSGHSVGWPRRSTVERSRGGLIRELRGVGGLVGCVPLALEDDDFLIAEPALDAEGRDGEPLEGVLETVLAAGRDVVAAAAEECDFMAGSDLVEELAGLEAIHVSGSRLGTHAQVDRVFGGVRRLPKSL
jgi:hypothetical protein